MLLWVPEYFSDNLVLLLEASVVMECGVGVFSNVLINTVGLDLGGVASSKGRTSSTSHSLPLAVVSIH